MAQRARPIADDSNTNWSPTPVNVDIREWNTDDADYVTSGDCPGSSTFKVRLTPIARPPSGPIQILMRLRKVGSDNIPVTVSLMKGNGDLIAQRTFSPGASFDDLTPSFILTPPEQALITDYADLHLQVKASCVVGCCEGVTLPDTLYAHFTNISGCPGFDGVTFALSQISPGTFFGMSNFGGADYAIMIAPGVGTCQLYRDQGFQEVAFYITNFTLYSCEPFRLEFDDVPLSDGGFMRCSMGGSYHVRIDENP